MLPTDPTIAPAMTPERWRASLTNGRAAAFRHPHLIAALALHDQPFGFTAADVAQLREAQSYIDDRWAGVGAAPDLTTVLAKIAALLPPEDA